MVFLYLFTIISFLLLFTIKYVRFLRAYYTQKTLTRLRDLRHDASLYLTEYNDVATPEGKREVRDLVSVIDHSIHHFDSAVKEQFMTFKGMKKMIIAISYSSNKIKQIEVYKDSNLVDYRQKFAKALLAAFNGVPFGRVRILFAFGKTILEFLVAIGIAKLQKYISIISTLETNYKEDLITSGKAKKHNLQPEFC